MYKLEKEIVPGTVVWAEKKVYYDIADKVPNIRSNMFVITMVNDDYFFGSPVAKNNYMKNYTVLSTKFYPIREDSRILECIYKILPSDIVSPKSFKITPQTLEHFRRNLYKKIILGHAISPVEYNEAFVQDFLNTHVPKVDNVIVYPSSEKILKHYYIYDEDEENYSLLRLNKEGFNYYIGSKTLETVPKDVRFFEYFTDHSLPRPSVEQIETQNYQKKLGSIRFKNS